MKLLIFDFDGTLADTRQSIFETAQATMPILGLPPIDEREIQKLIGLPLREMFVRAGGMTDETLIARAVQVYREQYDIISPRTIRLFPHVKEIIHTLHEQGYILSVASSKGRVVLMRQLEQFGILPYFQVVLGEKDVQHPKPAPDMILRILEETGEKAEDTLMIGDTQFDIAMGQNAHCHTCGVTYGNHSRQQLEEQGADAVIDDFADLLQVLEAK